MEIVSTDGHVLVVGSVMPKREEIAMTTTVETTQAVENFARLYTALRHDDARPLCCYCGRSYSSPSNLRQHVKNVHSNWPSPDTWPQCNVCGKRCKTKHYLINHQLQAHGIHQRPSMSNSSIQQQHQSPSSSSLPWNCLALSTDRQPIIYDQSEAYQDTSKSLLATKIYSISYVYICSEVIHSTGLHATMGISPTLLPRQLPT